MKLIKGQQAVDFTVRDVYDNEIKLSSYVGQKILLSFFRNVNCPFCNMRVHDLSRTREQFDNKGLKMIFFFENLIPADFLIDKNFIIQKAHYGSNLRDHLPVEEILSFADIS